MNEKNTMREKNTRDVETAAVQHIMQANRQIRFMWETTSRRHICHKHKQDT